MKSLEFKNYIVYLFGESKKFRDILGKFVEGSPSSLTMGDNCFICTFQTTFGIDELEEIINNAAKDAEPKEKFAYMLHRIEDNVMRTHIQSERLFNHLFNKSKMETKLDFGQLKPPVVKDEYVPDLDELLAKITETGYESLTPRELELLNNYSK